VSPVAIELANAPTGDIHALVGELEGELASEYPDEQRHGLDVPALFSPHVRFFVAKASGEAVGCGGVAIFPGYAEAKRMYVRPSARGRGIADALLARIEAETMDAGLTVLRLETGTRQTAAIRFYERASFRRSGVFGVYAHLPASSVETSVFYEKALPLPASAQSPMTDHRLWNRFHATTLAGVEWTHQAHLRIAWMYVQRYSVEEAHLLMRVGIVRLNAAHGLVETARRGYHETMTRTWLLLVAAATWESSAAESSLAFLEIHAGHLGKDAPLRHYSRERLLSLEARTRYVEPDLAPLDVAR
jgi:putative acetyltransferase